MSDTQQAAATATATSAPDERGLLRTIGHARRRGTVAQVASIAIFAVIFLPVYGSWLGSTFLSSEARFFDVYQNAPVMIVAIGLVVCLAAGQFDLSIGAMTTLGAFLTIGLAVEQGLPFGLVIVAVVGVGLVGGLVNGLLVVKARINAFIATLATGGIYEGLSNAYSGGKQLTQTSGGGSLPGWFTGTGSFGSFQAKVPLGVTWLLVIVLLGALALVIGERWPREVRDRRFWIAAGAVSAVVALVLVWAAPALRDVSWEIVFLFVVALAIWVLMRYTAYGRSMYAIGANPVAARLAGVRVDVYTIIGFMITGVCAAIGGLVLAANQGTAVPGIGIAYLLPAYAAVFLSTVILSDGRFHVWGTLIGGICVVFIAQGLIIGGVPFTWNQVINGLVLACAVAFATLLRGRDQLR